MADFTASTQVSPSGVRKAHLIEWALDNMAVILKDRDKAAG